MNDYPIAANAETIRLITFSASNRGGGLDEVALARCSNPNGPITDSCQSYCSSRCTGRAPLCITAGYNLLTGGIHHACVRARGVDTFPAPIFEPRSSLKDIRNLLSRWFIVFIGQFLQSCRWHCNSRAEEQLNKFFSGNYYYYLLFFFIFVPVERSSCYNTVYTAWDRKQRGCHVGFGGTCGGEGTETVTDKGCGPGSFGKGVG